MKKSIRYYLVTLALLCTLASAQSVVRWDVGYPGAPAVSTSSGSGTPYYSLPNPGFALCAYPANAVPCTNYATTYTDITGLTACSTSTQIVLQNSSSCQATGDNYGNLGVYTLSGTYQYTLTVADVSYGPYTITLGGSGGGGGCVTNPADNGCAIPGNPSIDLFPGSGGVGAGTGWKFQLLTSGLQLGVPLNVNDGTGHAGVVTYIFGTAPALGSGISHIAGTAGTPYQEVDPTAPGSGYRKCSNAGSVVSCNLEANIDLTADVGATITPVANGGTNSASASGALINLFPSPIRAGDVLYWNGSAWVTLGGCQTSTCIFSEVGSGAPGWIQSPIGVALGGTGLATKTLNTVYKGNTTSPDQATSIVDNGLIVAISEPLLTSNTVTLTTATTITSTSLVTAGLALLSIPISTTAHGRCSLIWEQSTAAATVTFGIGSSNTPTDLWVTPPLIWNGTALAKGSYTVITNSTPTNIAATITPASTATGYSLDFDFTLKTSGSNAAVVTIYGLTSSGSDALVIEPGSSCSWLP